MIVITAPTVTRFQARVVQDVKERLGYKVTVHPLASEIWQKSGKGQELIFSMFSDEEPTKGVFAATTGDRSYPVLPVFPCQMWEERTIWACWEEKWKSEGDSRFALLSVSWTFYWGAAHIEKKEQLFRAEWHFPSEAAMNAPQPHWHFDVASGLFAERPDLSGLHFGMAGWEHADTHPECWQCPLGGTTALVRWAKSVLEHAVSELKRRRGSGGWP